MIDALIWYTGLAAWVLIVLACVSILAAEINDRSMRRRIQVATGWYHRPDIFKSDRDSYLHVSGDLRLVARFGW